MKKSLLGELAERFVTQKENLASEALNIILNKSKEANQAVCNLISKLDDRIEKKLKFTTQKIELSVTCIKITTHYNIIEPDINMFIKELKWSSNK